MITTTQQPFIHDNPGKLVPEKTFTHSLTRYR